MDRHCIVCTPSSVHGDITYGQPSNKSLCQTIESIQYKAALAIAGAIEGTFQNYKELGLKTLKFR